jgi:tetratricopeptide (TPR) repeat protein
MKSAEQYRRTIDVIHSIRDWRTYRNFELYLEEAGRRIQSVYVRIFRLGQDMNVDEEFEMAKETFEALVAFDPTRPEAYLALVSIAQRENDSERKMELYHQLLAVSGNEPRILFNIALEHRNSEEWDDAKEFYLLYINAAPESVSGYRGLAFVNTALEKYDEAIAAYERAHLLEPENIDILMNMSDIFATMNNNEAAISVFKKVVALEDKFEDQEDLIITVRNLCTLLVRDQKWAEALTYAKIWYRLEPDSQASVNYVIYLARQARDTATQREFEEKLKKF